MTGHRTRRLLHTSADRGSATAFVAILAVALMAVAGLVLDAGLALSAKAQAMDAAQSAARAGANQLDLTIYRNTSTPVILPAAAQTAASQWLAAVGINGTATATTTHVTVEVFVNQPTQILTAIGITSLHVTASATAQVQQATTTP